MNQYNLDQDGFIFQVIPVSVWNFRSENNKREDSVSQSSDSGYMYNVK